MDNWEIYYRTHAKGVGKELTGSPPLTFVSNGEPLADYRIYGNIGGVGDRTGNLIDVSQEKLQNVSDTSATKRYGVLTEPLPQGVYTFFYNSPITSLSYRIVINGVYSGYQTAEPNVLNKINLPQYAQFFVYNGLEDATFANRKQTNIQLYSYKIPIVCGETTTNIYLDEPLNEGESISMSDTGVSIPTINGSNTLSVNTSVQPSSVYVKYATNERSVPARTYLQGVEKMDNWAIYNYINREGSGALKNESTLTSTTVEVRNTIQVTGAASGGTGSYQYAFYHKRSNAENWTTKSDYGAATTVEFSPYYVDTYKFKVNVKDSKGTIKSKIFNINVTAAVSATSNMPSLDKLSFDDTDELTIENDFNIADLTIEGNTPEEV